MITAALVLAAGLSSRMGDFKPLLPIGKQSMCMHVIDTYVQAGVKRIVVVTGRNAGLLESHVKEELMQKTQCGEKEYDTDVEIIFIHNPAYETKDMFSSIRVGVKQLQGKCDRFFMTPVDIPFVSKKTVMQLMEQTNTVVKPSFENRCGHPILLDKRVINDILQSTDQDNMKKILSCYQQETTYVSVEDIFILQDIDTKSVYEQLLQKRIILANEDSAQY